MKSPFKFLDAYTDSPADQAAFFGRDQQVEALYRAVRKNRLVLVYGQSGTGKTSLVQCGLAKKFAPTDWYPILVRRQNNINTSLQSAIHQIVQDEDDYSDNLIETITELNITYLRPIYLIFDQFEELLILGDYKKEQLPFAQTLKSLLDAPKLACHIILIFREEYMANLYPYERTIPQLFDRRLRVERMSHKNVQKVIYHSCRQFNIQLEKGREAIDLIIDNLSGERSGIPLPYLQVYLDLLYREDYDRTYLNTKSSNSTNSIESIHSNNSTQSINSISEKLPSLTFTLQKITDFGKIKNVLEKFLNQQIDKLQSLVKKQYPNLSSNTVRQVLDAFVTEDGTKQPLLYQLEAKQILLTSNAPEQLLQQPLALSTLLLQELENRRLLRRTETTFELAHDSLADLIDQQRTDEQRQLNEIKRRIRSSYIEYQETGEYLSRKQLSAYEDFLPYFQRNAQLHFFIQVSIQNIREKEQKDIQRKERELQLVKEKLETEQKLTKVIEAEKQKVLAAMIKTKKTIRKSLANELAFKAELALKDGNRTESFKIAVFAHIFVDPDNYKVQKQLLDSWYYNDLYPQPKLSVLFPTRTIRGHNYAVFHIIFSHDINKLATVSWNRIVKIWDVKNGRELFSSIKYEEEITSIAFSYDGNKIGISSIDNINEIWDINSGHKLLSLQGHKDYVNAIDFSPNGQILATASEDTTIKIWNTESGEELKSLEGHKNAISAIAFSPTGKEIASVSNSGIIKLWDMKSGKELTNIEGNETDIFDITFSQDNKKIAITSRNRIRIWRLEDWANISNLNEQKNTIIIGVSFSLTGNKLITVLKDASVNEWDINNNKKLNTRLLQNYNIECVSFSSDGLKIATGSWDSIVKIWNSTNHKELVTLVGHKDMINDVAFSSNNNSIVTASSDKKAKVWNIYSGEEILQLKGHTKGINGIAFSLNNRIVATASEDTTAIIWDIESEQKLVTLKGHTKSINEITFSSNSKFVATASEDTTAIIWDIESGQKLVTLKGHTKGINGIAFSSNSKFVATASEDTTAIIWDIESGKQLNILKGHTEGVKGIVFSSNSKFVATASEDTTAKIWNVNAKEMITLKGHNSSLYGIAFSPNGEKLATSSRDKSVKIWNTKNGLELFALQLHNDSVNKIIFTPDGKTIITASRDSTVKICNIDSSEIVKNALSKYDFFNWFSTQIESYNLSFAMENGLGFIYFLETANGQILLDFGKYYQESIENVGGITIIKNQIKKAEQCFRRAVELDDSFQKDLEAFLEFKEEKLKGME